MLLKYNTLVVLAGVSLLGAGAGVGVACWAATGPVNQAKAVAARAAV